MPGIAAANVIVSIAAGDRGIAGGDAFKMMSMASITFGDGALTYPPGGVPLPDIGRFGYHKAIQFVAIEQPPSNGFIYKFDRAAHKIKIFSEGFRTGTTPAAATGAGALAATSSGWEGTTVRIPDTVANTTYDIGPMIELPATITPPAVTLKMLLIGE